MTAAVISLQEWAQFSPNARKRHKQYHPGPPPEKPVYPHKKANLWLIRWGWYQYQRFLWRNHDIKRSPFWDYYRIFLKSGYWYEAQTACFVRDDYRCTDRMLGKRCKNDLTSKGGLQAHHLRYWDRKGRPLVGRELDNLWCLTTLCKTCHDRRHRSR